MDGVGFGDLNEAVFGVLIAGDTEARRANVEVRAVQAFLYQTS